MTSLWQWKRVVLNSERDHAADMATVVHLILVRVGTQRNNHKDAILPYYTNRKIWVCKYFYILG